MKTVKFEMNVESGNEAFHHMPTKELIGILSSIIKKIDRDSYREGTWHKYETLFDANGNRVGFFDLSIEESDE